MGADLSYPTAVLAGALSFLSPCVLPLVPPYLCYMAGVSADDLKTGPAVASTGYARLIGSAVIFVLGFSTVFIIMGATATSLSQILLKNMDWLAKLAGAAIIVMGLNFLGLFRLAFLSREARFRAPDRPKSLIGAYLMGLAFAFGWTPCIGPVLGAILGLAGTKSTVAEGALMLAVYSAGLGIPFVLAAAFSGVFIRWMSSFRRHLRTVEQLMGVLLVAAGVWFMTGGVQWASNWLLNTFPVFQSIG